VYTFFGRIKKVSGREKSNRRAGGFWIMSVIFVGREDSITYRYTKIKRHGDRVCSRSPILLAFPGLRPGKSFLCRAGLQPAVLIHGRGQAKSLTYDFLAFSIKSVGAMQGGFSTRHIPQAKRRQAESLTYDPSVASTKSFTPKSSLNRSTKA
jgi:hypothetical protein